MQNHRPNSGPSERLSEFLRSVSSRPVRVQPARSAKETSPVSPKASGMLDKLRKATGIRCHPDKLDQLLTVLETVGHLVPHLLVPGRISIEERLAAGEILIDYTPLVDAPGETAEEDA